MMAAKFIMAILIRISGIGREENLLQSRIANASVTMRENSLPCDSFPKHYQFGWQRDNSSG
ncbi:MAG TPA: hypothetical protein DD473_25735 [Planctomycetaceae bacterium]|nr:hypothetical protein [Planctomycetaceae bacterium]